MTKFEEFLIDWLRNEPQLTQYLGSGEAFRVHPTYSPSTLTLYPRITYDIVEELSVTYHGGAWRDYQGILALDVWSKGVLPYKKARAIGEIIRGDPPEVQKLHCFRGEGLGVFIQQLIITDYSADDTRPPFDNSSEPFYNVQFIFDFYYSVIPNG